MGFFKKIKTAFGGDDPQLMATGLLARAEVMNVQVTGASVQYGGAPPEQVCVFDLMVYLDNTPPFPAQARKRIPVYLLSNIQPGHTVVAARVDPNDHSRVGIDLTIEPPVVQLARTPGQLTAQDILERGNPCEAVIIQSEPLGVKSSLSGLAVYAFTLTVMIPGQAPYQIQVGNPVLPEAVPLIFPGSRLPAKVLPEGQPNDVVIDWKAALARHTNS
jgi:hypothetical protein